jgi:hypothetical protein
LEQQRGRRTGAESAGVDGGIRISFLGTAARAADWSGGDGGFSEEGVQRARALMAGSEFPSLEQPRGRRTGAAGMAGSARRGRRERGRERERAAGRTVRQKSVYVYTMVLYIY